MISNGGTKQKVEPIQIRNFIKNLANQNSDEFSDNFQLEMPWDSSYSICQVDSPEIAREITDKTQKQKYKVKGNFSEIIL